MTAKMAMTTILGRVSWGRVFDERPRRRIAQIFKIKNIFFELWVVMMQGRGVVGDVAVCCLYVLYYLMCLLWFKKKRRKTST